MIVSSVGVSVKVLIRKGKVDPAYVIIISSVVLMLTMIHISMMPAAIINPIDEMNRLFVK